MAHLDTRLVTIFGGSGFVGAHAVRALARRGWRIRVAVRHPNLAYELPTQGHVGQIQLVRCDVRSARRVEAALVGADAAVNLVGVLHESPGTRFHDIHVGGARNIARACAAAGIERLVQISAIGADVNSKSAYARTKGEAETVVREIVTAATILRPSVVFGPGDGFLNRFAAMASMSPVLPLIGGGETRFQPVYAGDVAEAVAAAVEARAPAGRTFELGGPGIYTLKEILELILRETRRSNPLIPLPFFAARMIGSLAGLSALVGVTPPITRDQVVMLETDNVVGDGAEGLEAFGVQPSGLEAIAPSYLWRYRRGGQFSERPVEA